MASDIRTKPISREYEEGFERTFGTERRGGGGRFRYNPETQQLEPVQQREEWINTGVRYGPEGLAEMKARGVVPESDFQNHWHGPNGTQKEKDRLARLGKGDLTAVKKDPKLREQLGRELYRRVPWFRR